MNRRDSVKAEWSLRQAQNRIYKTDLNLRICVIHSGDFAENNHLRKTKTEIWRPRRPHPLGVAGFVFSLSDLPPEIKNEDVYEI